MKRQSFGENTYWSFVQLSLALLNHVEYLKKKNLISLVKILQCAETREETI